MLSFSIHEHGTLLCLFRSSLISLWNIVLYFFVVFIGECRELPDLTNFQVFYWSVEDLNVLLISKHLWFFLCYCKWNCISISICLLL